jgi:hypothetical protein
VGRFLLSRDRRKRFVRGNVLLRPAQRIEALTSAGPLAQTTAPFSRSPVSGQVFRAHLSISQACKQVFEPFPSSLDLLGPAERMVSGETDDTTKIWRGLEKIFAQRTFD